MIRSAMRATSAAPRHAVTFARNPGRYARGNGGGAALLVFLTLLAISSARKGRYPTMHEAGVFAIAGVVVAISAQVAPEFVTTLLVVALLVVVIGNATLIEDYARRGFDALTAAAA